MKKVIVLLFVMFLSVGLLFSGGAAEQKAKKQEKMIAMIVPIPQGDPFISLCVEGIRQLEKDTGVEAKIIESLDKSEYGEQIRAMAELGANPIFVLWDDLSAEVVRIAAEFPDTKFIITDCYMTDPSLKNVKSIVVEPVRASFIAGFVAARTTKTGRIGWLGSVDMPVINKFKTGFLEGVEYGNPAVTVEALYIGDPNDPNKGSELAKQVIGKGADIVMHAANQSGLGVIRACQEMGVKAIGVDSWQGAIDEKTVFWSALKDITNACYLAGMSALDGSFTGGLQIYSSEYGINMYDSRDFNKLDNNLKDEVLQVVEKLRTGAIRLSE